METKKNEVMVTETLASQELALVRLVWYSGPCLIRICFYCAGLCIVEAEDFFEFSADSNFTGATVHIANLFP